MNMTIKKGLFVIVFLLMLLEKSEGREYEVTFDGSEVRKVNSSFRDEKETLGTISSISFRLKEKLQEDKKFVLSRYLSFGFLVKVDSRLDLSYDFMGILYDKEGKLVVEQIASCGFIVSTGGFYHDPSEPRNKKYSKTKVFWVPVQVQEKKKEGTKKADLEVQCVEVPREDTEPLNFDWVMPSKDRQKDSNSSKAEKEKSEPVKEGQGDAKVL